MKICKKMSNLANCSPTIKKISKHPTHFPKFIICVFYVAHITMSKKLCDTKCGYVLNCRGIKMFKKNILAKFEPLSMNFGHYKSNATNPGL